MLIDGVTLLPVDCCAFLLIDGVALAVLNGVALLPVDSLALLLIDGGALAILDSIALLLVHRAALLLVHGATLLIRDVLALLHMVHQSCCVNKWNLISDQINFHFSDGYNNKTDGGFPVC